MCVGLLDSLTNKQINKQIKGKKASETNQADLTTGSEKLKRVLVQFYTVCWH